MKTKISYAILFLFAFPVLASTIYPVQEGLFFKILRCGWHISCYRSLGSSVTEISGSTLFKNFPTSYNATINSLNNTKIENSSTSVAAITTLSNLVSVGTLTTGTWSASTIAVNKGGTGSTSPAGLLWGGSDGTFTSVGQGTAGQLLTSNGATIPTFGNAAVNLNFDYVWNGQHTFSTTSAPTTFQNTQIRMTNQNAALGIGTSSPFMALSVATNTYIGGGLAVGAGISTSTVGNVQIAGFVGIGGTTTTNGLAILNGNICVGCVNATTTTAETTLDTTSGNSTVATAICPANYMVIGGGFKFPQNANEYVPYESYASANDRWTVTVMSVDGVAAAGSLIAQARCVR